MSALALAIPAIASLTGREVVVIGGLAVVCRLTRPYRATSDLDTGNRRGTNEPAQLELLLASGAEASGVSGALVPTSAGKVQVDVLEVTDAELADLPDDPTDRLHVLSHKGAAATATPILIRASGMPDLTATVSRQRQRRCSPQSGGEDPPASIARTVGRACRRCSPPPLVVP
jgi:hypothetical protein